MSPVPLLTRALELGGVRMFVAVVAVAVVVGFLYFVGREMSRYFESRREQEAKYLSDKSEREERLTNELLTMMQATNKRHEDAVDKQQTVNAKMIEALNILRTSVDEGNSRGKRVEDRLIEALGWQRGRVS